MFRSISLFLGIFSIIISLFSILHILYSYYFEFYLNIKSYFLCFLISFIFGFFFIYLQKKDIKQINFFDKLFIVIIGFFYFPILISIPYFFSIYELSFIESYFEFFFLIFLKCIHYNKAQNIILFRNFPYIKIHIMIFS